MLRILRIYPLNSFQIYHIAVLTLVIMLYIASPVLITAGVKLLTAFIQFSHPLSSASDNYKFILLFYAPPQQTHTETHTQRHTHRDTHTHTHTHSVLLCLAVIPEWSSGLPYFLQFKSEFGNKEFMI